MVQKVNEGKARNSIQGDELLGREEPGSGLRAKGGVGDMAPMVMEPGCLLVHGLASLTSHWPQRSLRMSETLTGGLLCLDRVGDPFFSHCGPAPA